MVYLRYALKVMTKTEMLFKEWLLRNGYPEEGIRYNRKGSPDFILHDGRKVEVKRPVMGYMYFTRKQWSSLSDDVEVAVMHEDQPEPLAIVPFRKVREAYEKGGILEHGKMRFRVVVEPADKAILMIKCTEQTRQAFRLFYVKGGYKNMEEALIDLLKKANAWPTRMVF